MRRKPDASPVMLPRIITQLGAVRLAQERYSEAEALLRESSRLAEKRWPDAAYRYYVMSLLGASLAGQKNYADAEPLLLQSCQGLQQARPACLPISTPRAGSRNPSNGWCNFTTPGANPPQPPSGNRNWPNLSKPPKLATEQRPHKTPMNPTPEEALFALALKKPADKRPAFLDAISIEKVFQKQKPSAVGARSL